MEIWNLDLECAKRLIKTRLSLKDINSLINKGYSDINKNNIIEICKSKNIELNLIN